MLLHLTQCPIFETPINRQTMSMSAQFAATKYTEFEWILKNEDQTLPDFLQCPSKQRLMSPTFKANDLPFTIEAYPNGDNDSNVNSIMLYLTLLSLNKTYQEIMVNIRLYCRDTNTSFTSITKFTADRNSAGWPSETLHLDELTEFIKSNESTQLNLGCSVRILQITSNNKVTYRCTPPSNNSELKSITTLKWQIDSKLMNHFKHCRVGRCFESEIFDEMWCLRIYPNGKGSSGGNVKLYLLLCTAPSAIGMENEVLIHYTMWCHETDSGYNSRIALNAEYPTIGWPNKIMLTPALDALDSMTMNAEIEIITKHDDDDEDGSDGDDDDESDSSSSSYEAVKGIINDDEGDDEEEEDQKEDVINKNGDDKSHGTADGVDGDGDGIEQNEVTKIEEIKECKENIESKGDDVQSPEEPNHSNTDKPLDKDIDSDFKEEEPETETVPLRSPSVADPVAVEKEETFYRMRSKSKRKREGMTVEEFATLPLDDLVEHDIDSLDHYAMAKRICHYFDAQFGDTDTVCMVAAKGMQPAMSYWIKDEFVRKERDFYGRHVLVYRACGHRPAKEPVVTPQEFEKFVKGISIGKGHDAVDVIADKMDNRFGGGCHYARSTAEKPDFDIYCRFSDKYECGFKLPSGGYVIAWRR